MCSQGCDSRGKWVKNHPLSVSILQTWIEQSAETHDGLWYVGAEMVLLFMTVTVTLWLSTHHCIYSSHCSCVIHINSWIKKRQVPAHRKLSVQRRSKSEGKMLMSSQPTSHSFSGCLPGWSQKCQLSSSDYLTLGVVLLCDLGQWELYWSALALRGFGKLLGTALPVFRSCKPHG